MNRTIMRIALVAALLGLAVFIFTSFAQPLLSSRAYTVSATLNGAPIRAELLHPPFIPGTYYLYLPEARPQLYHWFGVSFSRQSVFSPVALYTGWRGLPYIHTDQAHGVDLNDGKIGDEWTVAFTAVGVEFSNASLSIALTKSP